MNLCRLFLTLFNLCFIYCLPLNALALSSRDIEVIPLVAEGTNCLSTTNGLNESGSPRQDKTRQDKTRQDIYYRNITSTIVWHAVSKKTLVEACQINSITTQILYYNK